MNANFNDRITIKKKCVDSTCNFEGIDFADPDLQSLRKCPQCSAPLKSTKELIFPKHYYQDLSPMAFMHPLDKSAIDSLRSMPMVNTLIKKMNEYGYEKAIRLLSLADDVLVTSKSCSYIYNMVNAGCKTLDIQEQPDTFINQDPVANAYARGVVKPMITITSGLIDLMTEDELYAVIAHELGHIKCEHVLYSMLLVFMIEFANQLGPAGFIVDALDLPLLAWFRKSELSADRAALIVTNNSDVCTKTLMKLAGGSTSIAKHIHFNDFLEQADKFEKITSGINIDRLMKIIFTMRQTHPFPVLRASEINKWKDSLEFKKIKKGLYEKIELVRGLEMIIKPCPHCGEDISKDAEWCINCFELIEKENGNIRKDINRDKCAKCGSSISKDLEWCPNCFNEID